MPTPPPLQVHELAIAITPEDMPDDRYATHVNNARYFSFINRTFQSWYRQMGLRGGNASFRAVMAHCGYDFLREVFYPGQVLCRITVVNAGRASLEHRVAMWDMRAEPVLAGRGKVVHVGIDPVSRRSMAWPQTLLAQCWSADRPVPDPETPP